jgi:serine/threonine protein kinase
MEETIVAGRFVIKKKISAGSFGVVYEAIDTKFNKKIAIKVEKKATRFPVL